MRSCRETYGDRPLAGLGYTREELAVLTIARHYCASFAFPERQGWVAAIASALAAFGDDLGPEVAVGTLAFMQAMRRTRQSMFHFNASDGTQGAMFVTAQERQLMTILRALRQGQSDAAAAHAALLCEGNDPQALLRSMSVMIARCLPPTGPSCSNQTESADPVLPSGS